MLLNFKEVKRKLYTGKNRMKREVMSYEFPQNYELINGVRFWKEKDIDRWISNYCLPED